MNTIQKRFWVTVSSFVAVGSSLSRVISPIIRTFAGLGRFSNTKTGEAQLNDPEYQRYMEGYFENEMERRISSSPDGIAPHRIDQAL